ncbi:hypothetical protein [Rathayibacter toxicus]|uniref:hypothetical protein n=1 Tax=Rathayibacter toxicus TaxID=145458 RepID=UPI001C053FC9|nr:hypothetical protein [Rathayibacter toxicus]QWL30904.1 hypothetical protein E2R34_09230 [Rathayibacter toxicus]
MQLQLLDGASNEVDFAVDDFLRRAPALSRLEGKSLNADDLLIREHGHVDIGDFRSERVRSTFPLGDLVLGDALEPVIGLLADGDLGSVLRTFAALADSHPYRIGFGAFSLRSHAEAYANWASARGEDPRKSWDERLLTVPHEVVADIRQRLDERSDSLFEQARASFLYAHGYADALIDAGLLSNTILDQFNSPQISRDLDRKSEFHQHLESLGIAQNPPERFAAYRAVLNKFYSMISLVDVTPATRYFVCYVISQIVDRETGVTWLERAKKIAQLRDNLRVGIN